MDTHSERKRRLVQEEVAEIALRLFRERGYAATTVDDLAAAAGMSRRTFFRYFRSKDEVVASKWRVMSDGFLSVLAQTALESDSWEALRRALDGVVLHYADPARRADSYAFDETVSETAELRAAFAEHLDATCLQAAIILERNGAPTLASVVYSRAAGAVLMTSMEQARKRNAAGIQQDLDEGFLALQQLGSKR